MNEHKRYESRPEISNEEIEEEREKELLEAFNQTEVHGEFIQDCIAATFKITNGEISDKGVVVSSSFDRERIFDPVGSFSGKPDDPNREYYASATVKDCKTGEKISVHANQEEMLIAPREEDAQFEAFRDYVLYLENKFHIDLKPNL
jgi:hypothetical protein